MRCPALFGKFATLLLVLLFCLLVNCKQPSALPIQAVRLSHTDDLGRKVAIPPAPQRIISLAPSLTETLFALGSGDRIVAVTTYCDFPAAATTKEKIGDTLKPNLERIIALKPDLVLISTASQLEKITQQLDQLEIPAFVSNPKTVSQVIASVRKIGEAVGAQEQAEALATEMIRQVDAAKQAATTKSHPRVLYVLQLTPLITAGKNTFINDLINIAGGKSISGEESTDYPQFSREAVIASAPEIIILPASHGTELVNLEAVKQAFATTPAVKNNRIFMINPDLIDRPGPRIIEGLSALEKALHFD